MSDRIQELKLTGFEGKLGMGDVREKVDKNISWFLICLIMANDYIYLDIRR